MLPWLCNSNASFSVQSCFVNKLRNLHKVIVIIKICLLVCVHNKSLKIKFLAFNLLGAGWMMYIVVIPSQENF